MKKIFSCAFTLFIALPLLATASILSTLAIAGSHPSKNWSPHHSEGESSSLSFSHSSSPSHSGIFSPMPGDLNPTSSLSPNSSERVDPNLNFYRFINFITAFPTGNPDPTLVGPSGFIFTPENHVVVANSGNSTSTQYTPSLGGINFNPGTRAPVRPTLFINVPEVPVDVAQNLSKHDFHFRIKSKKNKEPAEFIYSTATGKLLAYNRFINPLDAVVVVDNSSTGVSYSGMTIAKVCNANFLYVTEYSVPDLSTGRVDVFNSEFEFVKSFNDPTAPTGFVPFNVEEFNGQLYVAYANLTTGGGFVDLFTLKGKFIKRLVQEGTLVIPFGLALAPKNFGPFSDALLVADAGDGFIKAFDAHTGDFLGVLFDQSGPIQLGFLFDINFDHHNPNRPFLYFSTGTDLTNSFLGVFEFAGND